MKNFWYLALICLVSCNRGQVKVSGCIEQAQGSLLIYEQVRIGKNKILDSAALSEDGKFSFRSDLPRGQQDFFQLRIDSLPPVLLLLSAGDRVQVTASVGAGLKPAPTTGLKSVPATDIFAATLQVSGNAETQDLVLLQKKLWANNLRIDSILQAATDETEAQRQISKIFVEQKRINTTFIVQHIGSLAAAAAYYQKLGKSVPLFGYIDDRFLLAKMIDSLRHNHPKSPYIISLERDLEKINSDMAQQLLQEKIAASPVLNKPEIILPDIDGKLQSLDALVGNVVLLQFWSAAQPASKMDNRELLNLHKEFAGRKFKIYQVGLDTDSALWRNAVLQQQLPWTNVCCTDGAACKAALAYNISALPSNFLINKKGEIVAKNLFDKELHSKISQLLY
jgi:peroxiredoxin